MAATRRLQRELSDLLKNRKHDELRDLRIHENTYLQWTALIVPKSPPYNHAAFRIEFTFPEKYPFLPPKICFATKIYHPNIDEKGEICLPIISPDHWKPATKLEQVIDALLALVNAPEPQHSLRADIAQEFINDRELFCKTAEEFAMKYGEKRPKE